MPTVYIDDKKWYATAHHALETAQPLEAHITGWRARILRTQLPKIAAATAAVESGKKLGPEERFSLWHTLLLLRLHEILFFGLAHGYSVSTVDHESELVLNFYKEEPEHHPRQG